MSFDTFVAIDWSGARPPRYRGIAVARCASGMAPPALVQPPVGRRWTRLQVEEWLVRLDAEAERVLVGFDFAFALPFCDESAYFPGLANSPPSRVALWDTVESVSREAPDHYAGPFVSQSPFGSYFRWPRHHGRDFQPRLRLCDAACSEADLGKPESVFNLIGPKQVGRGSLAGMRVLRRMKKTIGRRLAVWPLEDHAVAKTVAVEIFPRAFLVHGGAGRGKIRDRDILGNVFGAFGSRPQYNDATSFDDHQTDALVSAAALRQWSSKASVWAPSQMTPCARSHEGWIFGVP